MMITMNRNFNPANLLTASETLRANDRWIIFTHAKSDGDAIGSACSLFEAGINAGKNVSWFSPDDRLPETYKYLAHFEDFMTREEFSFDDEGTLYVFLDCATELRSVSGFDTNHPSNSLNIDHHEDNTNYARVNCVDGSASSTCEMLYRVFTAGEWDITPKIAEAIYTGIFTDTGGFSFSNTSKSTHVIAGELFDLGVDPAEMSDRIRQNKNPADFQVWARALSRVKVFGDENIFAVSMVYADDFRDSGADMTGTEGLSQMFMSLRGVKFAAIATEYPDGIIRLSIRSREGSPFGAGEFAREFGGGGHEKAAGGVFPYPSCEVMTRLEAEILRKYHECISPHQ